MYIWQQTPEKRHVKEKEEGWRNKKPVDRRGGEKKTKAGGRRRRRGSIHTETVVTQQTDNCPANLKMGHLCCWHSDVEKSTARHTET